MKGALALRFPIVQGSPATLDTSGTNVPNNSFVQLQTAANNKGPCSAVQVTNGGSQPLMLAQGGAGNEVDTGVIIPPGGVPALWPLELKSGTRLSLKSLGAAQVTGIVTVGFLK